MDSSLEHIEFLASSENRVEVLRALHREPHTPRDLEAETNASRSTVGRVLKEFETRGWVERRDSGYETTPLGELIVDEFEPLLETMNRVEVLEEAVQWLPVDQLSLDLYELGDGDLIYPSDKNLGAHIEYGLDLVRESDQLRLFVNAMIPALLEVIRDCAVDGTLTSVHVFGATITETMLKHEHMSDQIDNILESGNSIYRYEGAVPYNFMILDRTVVFFLCDETYFPEALLETRNEPVLTWAESTFDSYRSESTSLEMEISA